MVGSLADEIDRAKRADEIAAFVRNENAMADRLPSPPRISIPEDQMALLRRFATWCAANNVRHCPARPTTVAAFVRDVSLPKEALIATMRAIEALHNYHSFSNPVETSPVLFALSETVAIEPPRSWPREDKARFAMLPVPIRDIIARREADREASLRRKQNEIANERKQSGADAKAAPLKGTEMAKKQGWERGAGPYSNSDSGITQGKPDSDKERDISRVVDANQAANDGAAGPLTSRNR